MRKLLLVTTIHTFTCYDLDLEDENIVSTFNSIELSDLIFYKQSKDSFQIVNPNCPSFIHIPSICSIIKHKFFVQLVPSNVVCCVYKSDYGHHALDSYKNLWGETKVGFFAKYNKIQLNCDKKLVKNEIIYFEDLVGFFIKLLLRLLKICIFVIERL